ncbi:MAG: hydroxyacid dehydrogenase, partial [Clostridia bacterium]|nr:hydroxyacid dehydrogenase [Clostridia bacterium]
MNILVLAQRDELTQNTFFLDWVREMLDVCGNVRYAVLSPAELKSALAGIDVLFAGWGIPMLDENMLENADRLKLICYTGGSVAPFANPALEKRGVRILSGNRIYAQSVAEGTIGYMLLAQRRLKRIIQETEETGWAAQHYTAGLRGKVVGLIGFGMIAKNLLSMLPVFGCSVKVCSEWYTEDDARRYGAEKCSLDEIFRTCDIISLHESLTKETYHMVGAEQFALMKDDALFVNTARGAIVDEAAMAEALRGGCTRAILDVYEKEPLPMESPLRGLEHCTLIPHRAGPTIDPRAEVTAA